MADKIYADLPYLQMEVSVLLALQLAGGSLTQSQLTVGPLRKHNDKERKTVLARLYKKKYLEKWSSKPRRGKSPVGHRITHDGRFAILDI